MIDCEEVYYTHSSNGIERPRDDEHVLLADVHVASPRESNIAVTKKLKTHRDAVALWIAILQVVQS